MTFDEYQEKAARTIASDYSFDQEMHALHGMVAETGEIVEAMQDKDAMWRHVASEIGDLYWMLAEYCTSHGWKMSEINSMGPTVEGKGLLCYDLMMAVGKLHGLYQKLFQGHALMDTDFKQALCNVLYCLNNLTHRFCQSVDECLEMNIAKLLARYPNGFEVERSVHRNKGDI